VAAEIGAHLPGLLLREAASVMRNPFAPLPSGHSNSLGTVLLQEMERCVPPHCPGPHHCVITMLGFTSTGPWASFQCVVWHRRPPVLPATCEVRWLQPPLGCSTG
jgi:hypothetical protein